MITFLPCLASRLHLVGQCDIIGPDIKLPFAQTKHPTVHAAAMYAHAHVHVHSCDLSHQSAHVATYMFINRKMCCWGREIDREIWCWDKLTIWPQSCPLPSPHSSVHDLPSAPEVQTHSNNNLPRSWSADSGFPKNSDITQKIYAVIIVEILTNRMLWCSHPCGWLPEFLVAYRLIK